MGEIEAIMRASYIDR